MQSYLDRGYDVVKMNIGAVPLDEDIRRIEAKATPRLPKHRAALSASS